MQTNPAVEQNKTLNGPRVCGKVDYTASHCNNTGVKFTVICKMHTVRILNEGELYQRTDLTLILLYFAASACY